MVACLTFIRGNITLFTFSTYEIKIKNETKNNQSNPMKKKISLKYHEHNNLLVVILT